MKRFTIFLLLAVAAVAQTVPATPGIFNLTSGSAGGGGGTVTSVSVTPANGVSGSVSNPTTTPAISLTLGAITPSTISSTGVAALNGATSSASTSLIVPAGTTGVSSLRIPHGVAPTSPVNGDMWSTTSGLFFRANGATVGPFGTGGGGTPAGSTGDIQTNNAGSFGALTPGTGVSTFIATPTSANLAAALTNETGTGVAVFNNTPTLISPVLGNATATSVTIPWTAGTTGTTNVAAVGAKIYFTPFTNATTTTITLPANVTGNYFDLSLEAVNGTSTLTTTGPVNLFRYGGIDSAETILTPTQVNGTATNHRLHFEYIDGRWTYTDTFSSNSVATGGTGVTSLTAYGPLFGGTTSTGPVQSGTVGTTGQVLTSNGAGALPTFQTFSGASLTATYAGYGSAGNALTGEADYSYDANANTLTVGAISLGAANEVSTIGALVDAVDGNTPLNNVIAAYAAGTVYSLTATSAAIDFGTTDPVVTIANAGTYLLQGRVNLKYNGATFAANRSVTLKIRRTNNTAADITGSSSVTVTGIVTTVTQTYFVVQLPPVVYTTTNTTDSLTLFADVSVVPSAGSLDAVEASLVAQRLY